MTPAPAKRSFSSGFFFQSGLVARAEAMPLVRLCILAHTRWRVHFPEIPAAENLDADTPWWIPTDSGAELQQRDVVAGISEEMTQNSAIARALSGSAQRICIAGRVLKSALAIEKPGSAATFALPPDVLEKTQSVLVLWTDVYADSLGRWTVCIQQVTRMQVSAVAASGQPRATLPSCVVMLHPETWTVAFTSPRAGLRAAMGLGGQSATTAIWTHAPSQTTVAPVDVVRVATVGAPAQKRRMTAEVVSADCTQPGLAHSRAAASLGDLLARWSAAQSAQRAAPAFVGDEDANDDDGEPASADQRTAAALPDPAELTRRAAALLSTRRVRDVTDVNTLVWFVLPARLLKLRVLGLDAAHDASLSSTKEAALGSILSRFSVAADLYESPTSAPWWEAPAYKSVEDLESLASEVAANGIRYVQLPAESRDFADPEWLHWLGTRGVLRALDAWEQQMMGVPSALASMTALALTVWALPQFLDFTRDESAPLATRPPRTLAQQRYVLAPRAGTVRIDTVAVSRITAIALAYAAYMHDDTVVGVDHGVLGLNGAVPGVGGQVGVHAMPPVIDPIAMHVAPACIQDLHARTWDASGGTPVAPKYGSRQAWTTAVVSAYAARLYWTSPEARRAGNAQLRFDACVEVERWIRSCVDRPENTAFAEIIKDVSWAAQGAGSTTTFAAGRPAIIACTGHAAAKSARACHMYMDAPPASRSIYCPHMPDERPTGGPASLPDIEDIAETRAYALKRCGESILERAIETRRALDKQDPTRAATLLPESTAVERFRRHHAETVSRSGDKFHSLHPGRWWVMAMDVLYQPNE